MDSADERLIAFLHDKQLLIEKQDISVLSGADLGVLAYLAADGLLDEMQAIRELAAHFNIQYCDLDAEDIRKQFTIKELVKNIDASLCRRCKILPIFEDSFSVTVAQVNPLDLDSQKDLAISLGKPVKAVLVEEEKLERLMKQFLSSVEASMYSDAAGSDSMVSIVTASDDDCDEDLNSEGAAPAIKIVQKILFDAIELDASDIHVEPNPGKLIVRFRVDGTMQTITSIPKPLQSYITARFKLLAQMDISDKRKPQDGRIRVKSRTKTVDMRVSAIPVAHGEKIVIRLLRSDYDSMTIEGLGFAPKVESSLKQILRAKDKLFVVTGPTGSGKTTTLYTCINFLLDGKRNITTVEDPIEYKFAGVNQVQVKPVAGVTFASALRSILRQDPDIIMIGEIRDEETANIALQAAQTGHLMLSTLHTNSAPLAISRLSDLGIEPFAIASSLGGVLAQRLLRKNCEECSEEVQPDSLEEYPDYLSYYAIDVNSLKVGKGCPQCAGTGYQGRIPIYSYLAVDDELGELISKEASSGEIIEQARKNGFTTLEEAVLVHLRTGVVSFDEAVPYLTMSSSGVSSQEETLEVAEANKTSKSIERPRILLIDDSLTARKLLSAMLTEQMFEVIEAKNGQDGLQKVYEKSPSAILCDLSMPVMDGRVFLKKIKAIKETKNIPVVILTGDSQEEHEAELLSLGAKDFVSKDASGEIIVRRILNALKN